MKKNIFQLYEIIFHCINCDYKFQTNSFFEKNKEIESCKNCAYSIHNFAKKASAVRKFRIRQEKTSKKTSK